MDRKKFLDFMDMIDGGGAGKTGDKFQGGGLFSALANAVATPYGSEDDERMKAMMERRMSAGLIDRPQAPAPQVVRSAPTPAPQQYSSSGMTPNSAYVAPTSGGMSLNSLPYSPPPPVSSSPLPPYNMPSSAMLTEQQNIDRLAADREQAAYLFSQAQAAQGTPSYAAALQEYQTFANNLMSGQGMPPIQLSPSM